MGAEEQLSENRNRMKCLDIADLDEDGDPDIVSFCMSQTCLMWYENRLSDEGTWLSHRVPANTGRSMEVQLLDWNADGAPDLLSGSSNGEIYFSQNPQQTGADWPTQLIRTNAGSISALASLDPEEGQLSGAVVASMDQVSVVRRSDQELVFRPVAYKPRSATSATMCDTDLDGEPEIIVCDAADSCLILYDPTLSHAGCYRLTTIAECIPATLPFFSADLDGDEDLDLVFGQGMRTAMCNGSRMDIRRVFGPVMNCRLSFNRSGFASTISTVTAIRICLLAEAAQVFSCGIRTAREVWCLQFSHSIRKILCTSSKSAT